MFVEFQVVIEFDPKTNSYCGTAPGLPVFVDADRKKETVEWVWKATPMDFREVSWP